MSTVGGGGSAADEQGDEFDRLRVVGICLGAGALGFVGMQFWGIVFYSALGGPPLTDQQTLLIGPPVNGLGMLTGAAAYIELSDRDVSFFDVRAPDLREIGYAIGGLVALFGLLQVISIAFWLLGVTTAEHGTAATIRASDPVVVGLLAAGAMVFIGPGEELLFRNVVQKRLYGVFSRYGAIAVASVIFALVHFSAYATGTVQQGLASLLVVFALSLLLGWIYHRTENVIITGWIHGAYDALTFAFIYAGL